MPLPSTSAVDDTITKTIECPVCIQVFEDPKTLQCGHSLCLSCVEQLPKMQGNGYGLGGLNRGIGNDGMEGYSIRCPVCRKMTVVPEEGLCTNFVLQGVISRFREIQKKAVDCSSCGRNTAYDSQLICESCTDDVNTINIYCITCAVEQHAHQGHYIVQKSSAFARVQEETLIKIHAITEGLQIRINNTVHAASDIATLLTDLEFLSEKLQYFDDTIARLEELPFCTEKMSKNTISRAEELNSSLNKISMDYEALLCNIGSRIRHFRQDAKKALNNLINEKGCVESCSPENADALGGLKISSSSEAHSINVSPNPFKYQGYLSCRESRAKRRAALLLRRRTSNVFQRSPSPVGSHIEK